MTYNVDHKKILTNSQEKSMSIIHESNLDPIQTFLLEFSTQPIRALLMYLHKKIIPLYKKFEEGHKTEHVLGIIKWSSRLVKELGNKIPVDINLMYTVAAFHDTGLKFGMAGHDKNVVRVIDEHKKDLMVWFDDKEIKDVAEACLYHDPKNGKKPTNIYGVILHDAGIIQTGGDVSDLLLPDSKKFIHKK